MKEVKPMRDVDFLVLSLYPSELVDDFIAPLVHALVTDVHLGVEDPQKAETFLRQRLHWNVHDLSIRHSLVVQIEFIVGEHERSVVSLGSLDSPRRVDHHYFEVAQLVHNVLQIEESQITVDECVGAELIFIRVIDFIIFTTLFGFFLQTSLVQQLQCNYLSFRLLREGKVEAVNEIVTTLLFWYKLSLLTGHGRRAFIILNVLLQSKASQLLVC